MQNNNEKTIETEMMELKKETKELSIAWHSLQNDIQTLKELVFKNYEVINLPTHVKGSLGT